MPFVVTIERIIPGGRGLGFHDGRPVFVPFSVPGDQILVTEYRDRKSYLEALRLEVQISSGARRPPPCPHFGSCGGCDLQQIDNDRQLEFKQEILLDALKRVGKIEYPSSLIEMIPSPAYHYRNRIQVKVSSEKGTCLWGFYQSNSHKVIPVDYCMIGLPVLWDFLVKVMARARLFQSLVKNLGAVEILQGDGEQFRVSFQLKPNADPMEALQSDLEGFGCSLQFPQASFWLVPAVGEPFALSENRFVVKTVGDLTFRVGPGAFFQVNEYLLKTLQDCATLGTTGKRALDLFCGVGFFSLALAKFFDEVLAVEVDPSSSRDLLSNLALNKVANCRFFSEDVGTFLRNHRQALAEIDLILLDPPRAGLGTKLVADIASLGSPDIVYVSCDPTTLARDVRILTQRGYDLISLVVLDLFPQTHHLETVARLRKGENG